MSIRTSFAVMFVVLLSLVAPGCSGCSSRWPPGGGAPPVTPRPVPPTPGATFTCGVASNVFTVYVVQIGSAACDLGTAVQVRAPDRSTAASCPALSGITGLGYAYPGYPSPPGSAWVCHGYGLMESRVPAANHDAARAVECERQTALAGCNMITSSFERDRCLALFSTGWRSC